MKIAAFLTFIAASILGALCAQTVRKSDLSAEHVQWVADSLKQMESVKPGMTRADLLRTFTTEGGISTRTQRTYVSQRCPYFKVDVEFEAVGPAEHDSEGRDTFVSSLDRIKKI